MAIRLEVEEYCGNCCDFKPNVDKSCYFVGHNEARYNTTITCKNADKCELIRKYLEKNAGK